MLSLRDILGNLKMVMSEKNQTKPGRRKKRRRKLLLSRMLSLRDIFGNLKIVMSFGEKKVHADARWMNLYRYFDDLKTRKRILILNLHRILPLLALMAVLGYVGAAGGLYLWLDRNHNNKIGFWDLALPFRWSTLRAKQGQGFIADGLEDLKEENIASGLMKLRIGLIKFPEDQEARLELARLYARYGLADRVLTSLEEGLDYRYPSFDYLSLLFETAGFTENYLLTLRVTEQLLQEPANIPDPAIHALLLKARIQAFLKSERYLQALQLSRRLNRDKDKALNAVDGEVLALFGLKLYPRAVALLEVLRLNSEPSPMLLQLLAQAYRHMGNMVELRDILRYLIQEAPSNPQPYLFAMNEWRQAGQPERVQDVFEDYLINFGQNERAIQALSAILADWPNSRLVKRCMEEAEKQGFDTRPFLVILVQSLLAEGGWSEASIAFSLLERGLEELPENIPSVAPFMMQFLSRLITALEPGNETGPSVLVEFFSKRRFPSSLYLSTADMLEQSGKWTASREILGLAHRIFPHSANITDHLNLVDKRIAELKTTDTLPKADSMEQELATPEEALAALDKLIASNDLGEALVTLRKLRRQKPLWLEGIEEVLAGKQLLITVKQGDTHYAQAYARLYLEKYPHRGTQVIDLARVFRDHSNIPMARALGRAVAAQLPYAVAPAEFLDSLPPEEARAGPVHAIQIPAGPTETFQKLDALIEEGESTAALALLQKLQRSKPEWLEDAEEELALRQLLITLQPDDMLYSRSAIRRYLAKKTYQRNSRAITLAQRYLEGGELDIARLLAMEVLEEYPENEEAAAFLQALESEDTNAPEETNLPATADSLAP